MNQIKKNTPIDQRIKDGTRIDPVSGCWEWQGVRNYKGYGQIGIGSGIYKAHRAAYKWFRGDIPDRMQVCHKCDNPSCCNPDHLFLGTTRDNTLDAKAKNRLFVPHGEKQGNAVLTESDIKEILKLWNRGDVSQTEIGYRFNVSQSSIHLIVHNKSWKHIPRTEGGAY